MKIRSSVVKITAPKQHPNDGGGSCWARSARVGNKAITANHDRLLKDDEGRRGDKGKSGYRRKQGGIEFSRTDRAIFEKWTTKRERETLSWGHSMTSAPAFPMGGGPKKQGKGTKPGNFIP